MTSSIFVALGSNLGDRRANIQEAREKIREIENTRIVKESSLYQSEPHGNAKTWFVNGVIELESDLLPQQILKNLLAVEKTIGRKRVKGKRWGSRVIDLDLLFHGSLVIGKRNLKIPHPRLAGRRFVLMPLAELAPQLVHPVTQMTVSEMLARTPDTKQIELMPLRG